jgi:hypothetical protein
MKFRIDFEIDKFTLVAYAEHFIYLCRNNDVKQTKVNFEKFMRKQLMMYGNKNKLERYDDLTRLAMKFLVKKYKIKFY